MGDVVERGGVAFLRCPIKIKAVFRRSSAAQRGMASAKDEKKDKKKDTHEKKPTPGHAARGDQHGIVTDHSSEERRGDANKREETEKESEKEKRDKKRAEQEQYRDPASIASGGSTAVTAASVSLRYTATFTTTTTTEARTVDNAYPAQHFAISLQFSDPSRAPSNEQLRTKANELIDAVSRTIGCHIDLIGSTLFCRGPSLPTDDALLSAARLIAGSFPAAQFSLTQLHTEADETNLTVKQLRRWSGSELQRIRRLTGRSEDRSVSTYDANPPEVPLSWPQLESVNALDTADLVLFAGEGEGVRNRFKRLAHVLNVAAAGDENAQVAVQPLLSRRDRGAVPREHQDSTLFTRQGPGAGRLGNHCQV